MSPEEQALAELQTKTLTQIQIETAFTWAYRAWAASKLGLMNDFTEYFHEAVEHAALSGNDTVLAAVRKIVHAYIDA